MIQEDKVMYTLTKEESNEKALVYIGRQKILYRSFNKR